jgi:hypothetical protein
VIKSLDDEEQESCIEIRAHPQGRPFRNVSVVADGRVLIKEATRVRPRRSRAHRRRIRLGKSTLFRAIAGLAVGHRTILPRASRSCSCRSGHICRSAFAHGAGLSVAGRVGRRCARR